MTKDEWIQKAKALLYDYTVCDFNYREPLNQEATNLLGIAKGYDPFIETSKTQLKWDISPIKILELSSIKNPDIIGELFREWAFVEPFGCYSCFDLIEGFEEDLSDKKYRAIEVLQDGSECEVYCQEVIERASVYYNKEYNVVVAWHWNGDGTLYFKHGETEIVNTDCKKDYTWEFVLK